MPVTGVVGDDVDDDLDAVRMQIGDEVIKVIEGSEDWIDVAQVDDVVSTVNESGWVEGAEPHGVDLELDKVIDVVADTGQVANSVTIGVGEATRINLIDGSVAPPLLGHRTSCCQGRQAYWSSSILRC